MMSFLKINKSIFFISILGILIIIFFVLKFQIHIFHFFYKNKTWVHKVNTLQKLNSVNDKFVGVELDIFYVDSLNVLDIYHPPEKSNNLFFESYLINDKINYKYWLDLKNLTVANQLKIIQRLNYLVNAYKLNKSSIIIESTKSNLLKLFSDNNFITSYYLPSELYRTDKEELLKKCEIIKVNINNYSTNFISTNYLDYSIIKKEFPKKEILTWIIDDNPKINSFKNLRKSLSKFKHRLKVFRDKKVKVVLVKQKFSILK
jgi:hypothetical protein